MDAIDQRKALASALSAHDLGAVKSCLHPSFVVRGTDGAVVMDYAGLLNELPKFFDHHPEYKQSVEVEASQVDGDTARLTTRHIDVLRTWRRPRDVPSRWDETWKTVGDKWVLVEERPHPA
jgi:hypothetical protein